MRQPESPAFAGSSRILALAKARDFLRRAGIEEAEADARLLTFAACGFDGLAMLREPDTMLRDDEANRLSGFLVRRAQREPASRILGRRPFWNVEIAVHPGVLDPRADTEAIVRLAERAFPEAGPRKILDLGSGSGAVLCALLIDFPGSFGVAVDLSADACRATAGNLRLCGVADRSAVVQADWTSALGGSFDLIVSNPPYIPHREILDLPMEVRGHDPHLALDGGEDGLDAYRALLSNCAGFLGPTGRLIFEFGQGQGPAVRSIATGFGLAESDCETDFGGLERALAFAKTA